MHTTNPQLILGICDSHDAGAALICEGRILAAANEERFNRKKMAAGFPARCLEEIWRITGVKPADVQAVALAGRSSAGAAIPINNDFTSDDGTSSPTKRLAEWLDRTPGGRSILASDAAQTLYQSLMPMMARGKAGRIRGHLLDAGVTASLQFFEHHDSHVASAYYAGGERDCLVVSNDGFGDGLCAKVAVPDGPGGALRVISSNHFVNSLGVYYNYVTHFCGFSKSHHAGKTTGLAAYGDPEKTMPIFQRLIEWDADRGIYVNRGKLFGNCLQDIHEKLAGFSREDAAAGIQRHCENILVAMVRHYIGRTGRRKIVLTGGVHANVKANQRIAEIPGVDTVFVFPNMGDGGLALGAAFLAYARANPGGAVPVRLENVYLGPAYSERDIADCLNRAGVAFSRPDRLAAEVARLLKENKIVARFDGRMEYGPRALGNRSILYPATNPSVNQWLNTQLRRTEFMPFAPVVRESDAAEFFHNYDRKTAHTAEFMTITYNVTDRCKKEAPAIVHVDGTARPQVLRRAVNPGYYDILEEYHKLTSLSVLVNTSFNMHEEPIVCTPDDALKAFFESHLDAIAIGPFLVLNSRK